MEQYVGLDISMEESSLCVLDEMGSIIFEGNVPSRPEAIAKVLQRRAPKANRIVFETGSLSMEKSIEPGVFQREVIG